jgi:hypothetical protein
MQVLVMNGWLSLLFVIENRQSSESGSRSS